MASVKENRDLLSLSTSFKSSFVVNKKVRTAVTVDNKLKIIERLKSGASIRAIASEFGISKSQVHRVGLNKENIQSAVQSGNLQVTSKIIVNKSKQKDLDDAVYKWFHEMRNPSFRCKPLSIARAHIQARAFLEADLQGITYFKASDGWFRNWKKRCGVGASIRLHGEAGDVDVSGFVPAMNDLRSSLSVYDPENIFNMDETGLFYRAMPARTYLAANENRQTVRGTKALKAKYRVTLVLCVNSTGNFFTKFANFLFH